MPFWYVYMFSVFGILISIALPILRESIPGGKLRGFAELWEIIKPYLVIGLFSLLTALLVVAFTQGTLTDWKAALLAGYAWDSTIQKLKG